MLEGELGLRLRVRHQREREVQHRPDHRRTGHRLLIILCDAGPIDRVEQVLVQDDRRVLGPGASIEGDGDGHLLKGVGAPRAVGLGQDDDETDGNRGGSARKGLIRIAIKIALAGR